MLPALSVPAWELLGKIDAEGEVAHSAITSLGFLPAYAELVEHRLARARRITSMGSVVLSLYMLQSPGERVTSAAMAGHDVRE